LAQGAAYGAVVVQACKALAELHDVKGEPPQPLGLSMEDVGREVRVVSPLLMERLEQIRELSGSGRNQTEPNAAGFAIGGIPVEGETQGPAIAAGVKSPLLDGSVTERMIYGVMRRGEHVVQKAQLEGADAALEAMPAKRNLPDDCPEGTK
jgi:hypothetical protein